MRIAIIENSKVTNVIEGELEVVQKLFNNTVSEDETSGFARIGARWNGKKFEPPRIYPSWTWNESTFEYEPPKPKPEGDYHWSESELKWLPTPVEAGAESDLPVLETGPKT